MNIGLGANMKTYLAKIEPSSRRKSLEKAHNFDSRGWISGPLCQFIWKLNTQFRKLF
jgi:hypothetical protein